jgi:hypothetical protein
MKHIAFGKGFANAGFAAPACGCGPDGIAGPPAGAASIRRPARSRTDTIHG